jgi:hypothetical protein
MDYKPVINLEELTLLPEKAVQESGSNHRPPDYQKDVNLLDGSQARIRPLLCEEREAIVKFYARLSEDTRFLRYHYHKGELTDGDIKTFCDLDYRNVLALVAEKELDGHKAIIGVGRYIRIPPDHTAEVALVVQDNEQQKGIGTQLLRHLAILASQRDIQHFIGEVLRENGRMLSIFRKADPGMGQEVDSPSTCVVNLSVAEIVNSMALDFDMDTCAVKYYRPTG